MSLKREPSNPVVELNSAAKRLHIEQQAMFNPPDPSPPYFSGYDTNSGPIDTSNLTIQPNMTNPAVMTVMSHAEADFEQRYERLHEIGRGGFSVVYSCRDRRTNELYAVKVIDLRPLRLRERFNPTRLRREVDIMRRLRHTNIIQFVEVFESPDYLMVVMEYAPGTELFDVILARKHFTEEDARPIFAQVSSALAHLHSMDIIHRDIKPENILVLNKTDPISNTPIIKLLDFGLSKHAGLGSVAKTFVGTPCYLAPEVEFTAKGQGGTYGSPVDCWSLGAVLYVMLVARFPEFERDPHNPQRITLKLPPALWGNVSEEAKDLIRSLMKYDPDERLTAREAMEHPWLRQYRVVSSPRVKKVVPVSPEAKNLWVGTPCTEQHKAAMKEATGMSEDELQIEPLYQLQRDIAQCFEEASKSYAHMPEVSAKIRQAAITCRAQLTESTKMLRKIEQTAVAVLNMFPDLILAVEEAEPQLANDFFDMVRQWVGELLAAVSTTQGANKASIDLIQSIVSTSASAVPKQTHTIKEVKTQDIKQIIDTLREIAKLNNGDDKLSQTQILELFLNLFGQNSWQQKGMMSPDSGSTTSEVNQRAASNIDSDGCESVYREGFSRDNSSASASILEERQASQQSNASGTSQTSRGSDDMELHEDHVFTNINNMTNSSSPGIAFGTPNHSGVTTALSLATSNGTVLVPLHEQLTRALNLLQRVDQILERVGVFWSNTEVVLDVLTKKGRHVEQFISFAHKPKLMARFKERIDEYKNFWESILAMSSNYLCGITEPKKRLDMCSAEYCIPHAHPLPAMQMEG